MSLNVSLARLFEEENSSSNQTIIELDNEEKAITTCLHYFGYLAERSKNAPFAEKCLLCSKVVECILPFK